MFYTLLKFLNKFNTQDLTKLAYPDGYDIPEELQRSLQETICYIQYYKAELQYLEDMKYE